MKAHRRISRRTRMGVEPLEGRALLTAGALDPTFGAGAGYVKTDLGPFHASNTIVDNSASVVAVEPWDGKIVAAVSSWSATTGNDFVLVRYNTDGSLDTTFGNGGVVRTDFNKGDDNILTLVFTPDHKIDAVGQAYVAKGKITGEQIAVARYNTNGTLDSTFGSGGKVTITASTLYKYDSSQPIAAALDPSGDLVIAGSYVGTKWGSVYTPPFYFGSVLLRLSSSGALDSTFGSSGILLGSEGWDALRLQPAGTSYKIDLVGADAQGRPALMQLNANGGFDTTFGTRGEVLLAGDGFSGPSMVAYEPDGGFVGINHAQNDSFTVTRYDASGNVVFDKLVNYGALLPPGTPPSGFGASAVAIDPSGQIVLGGQVLTNTSYGNLYIANSALVRLDSSGNLDTTFGNGGLVVNHFAPYDDAINTVAFQSDGSIIAAGYIDEGSVDSSGNLNQQNDVLVARYQNH